CVQAPPRNGRRAPFSVKASLKRFQCASVTSWRVGTRLEFALSTHVGFFVPLEARLLAVFLGQWLRFRASGKRRGGERDCETQNEEQRSKLLHGKSPSAVLP